MRPAPALRYAAAVLLALAAQLARFPLHPPTLIPYITYIPFIALGAAYGGFGPGLLTTALCFFESLYFATEPLGTLTVRDPRQWAGLGSLLLGSLVICILFDRARRARAADASTRELAALLHQTYDAVFVWKLENEQITFWDRGALGLYGYSGHEALGRSAQDLLATQFPEKLASVLAAIPPAGYWEGELLQTTRDGRRITVESRMSLRQGEDGQFLVIEVVRDISERKRLQQTQAQLAHEQELRHLTLESIIENSPACIALLRGPDFTFETVNSAYQALVPGEPMLGRTIADVWPEAAPLVWPLLNAVREAQTVYQATGARLPLRRARDGPVEERYFDFSYVPLPGPDGEVQVLAVVIEVTRHKKAEEELRAINQELTTIYDSAPVALMVVDSDLQVRRLNDMAARFGEPMESALAGRRFGGPLGCLSALSDPQGCGHAPSCAECALRIAVLDSIRNGARHDDVEVWLPFSIAGQTKRRCLSVSTTIMPPGGKKEVLVCAHDITQLKIAEEALRETVGKLESALAQKTILLQEVHHRVKNNLAVISSLLSMKADAAEMPEARMALEESQRRVFSIALIHEQLYGSDHVDRINIAEYIRQLVEQLQFTCIGEPERIAITLDAAPIEMGVHRAVPCALILNELISNAFKHAFPDGRRGEVRVSLRESDSGTLEFAIEDNGVGSPPGMAGLNPKSLGLKIVGILSRQLEGSFAQEAADGGGTRFVLRIPAGNSHNAA